MMSKCFLIAVIATSCFAATISNNERRSGSIHQYVKNDMESLQQEHRGLKALYVDRIVGGNPITIEEIPWIVSLRFYGIHRCGGSLIRPNRVLTAAHCTVGLPANGIEIRAGSTYHGNGGHLRLVSGYLNHPYFSSTTMRNDISVVYFNVALDTNLPSISVISLPNQSYSADVGSLSQVSGWGATCESCSGSPFLRYVMVPIISNNECNTSYNGSISDGMMCAGFPDGNKDACQGDSGGPLTFNHLEGIVSWGTGCARPNFPGVYTRVSYFRKWIDQDL